MNGKFLKIQAWKVVNNVCYNVKPDVKELVSADDTETLISRLGHTKVFNRPINALKYFETIFDKSNIF